MLALAGVGILRLFDAGKGSGEGNLGNRGDASGASRGPLYPHDSFLNRTVKTQNKFIEYYGEFSAG